MTAFEPKRDDDCCANCRGLHGSILTEITNIKRQLHIRQRTNNCGTARISIDTFATAHVTHDLVLFESQKWFHEKKFLVHGKLGSNTAP